MWTKGNGVQAADSAIASYNAQAAELEGANASISADRELISAQYREALLSVARGLLPDAQPATLVAVARELGQGWLPNRRQELEQQRAQWQQRVAAIEADPQFLQREHLLHPTHGGLARERQQCEALSAQLHAHLARFQTETFQWLQSREVSRQLQSGGFSSFWDAVTFGGYREDRAKQRCASELGYENYDQLLHDFQSSDVRLRQVHDRMAQLDALRQQLIALLEEHGKLYAWTHDFEARLCEMLHEELGRALSQQDLRMVHMRIRPALRPLLSRAHALQKKYEYLGNLGGFVQGQVADRQHRVQAIQKTRLAWAMKPWDRLTSDKSKWLLALPAAKRESTHKQLRWARSMHKNVVGYDDYDDYDYYLGTMDDFLAYDAFAWGAEDPMPYEGFSRGIIPELGHYRESHQQERADYSAFRSADKQHGAEEPSGRDELAEMREQIYEAHGADEGLEEAAAAAVAADHALEMADAS